MAKTYRLRPSELLGVDDTYTAYCFDEACFYFEARLAGGQKPVYESKRFPLRPAKFPIPILYQKLP